MKNVNKTKQNTIQHTNELCCVGIHAFALIVAHGEMSHKNMREFHSVLLTRENVSFSVYIVFHML